MQLAVQLLIEVLHKLHSDPSGILTPLAIKCLGMCGVITLAAQYEAGPGEVGEEQLAPLLLKKEPPQGANAISKRAARGSALKRMHHVP